MYSMTTLTIKLCSQQEVVHCNHKQYQAEKVSLEMPQRYHIFWNNAVTFSLKGHNVDVGRIQIAYSYIYWNGISSMELC